MKKQKIKLDITLKATHRETKIIKLRMKKQKIKLDITLKATHRETKTIKLRIKKQKTESYEQRNKN